MPRNMVTRMVRGTLATVKLADKKTDSLITKEILLERTPYKEGNLQRSIAKAIQKQLSEDQVLIHVEKTEQIRKCYGVPADDFMKLAVELDPETRKPITEKEN